MRSSIEGERSRKVRKGLRTLTALTSAGALAAACAGIGGSDAPVKPDCSVRNQDTCVYKMVITHDRSASIAASATWSGESHDIADTSVVLYTNTQPTITRADQQLKVTVRGPVICPGNQNEDPSNNRSSWKRDLETIGCDSSNSYSQDGKKTVSIPNLDLTFAMNPKDPVSVSLTQRHPSPASSQSPA